MRGDRIPGSGSVSRYCRRRFLDGDRIAGAAFQVRAGQGDKPPEAYLSVNWLEYLSLASRIEEIEEIRRVLGNKLRLQRSDRIAVGQVGAIERNVRLGSPDHRRLTALHEPEVTDISHSGLHGLRYDDDLLYGELIAEVCQESYLAKVD